MLRQVLALFIIGGLTSSCSMQPIVPKTPSVDETYTQIQSTTQPSNTYEQPTLKEGWWHAFNDPVLNRLIAQSIQANPNSLSALSTIREARAYQNQINANSLPSVTASAGANAQYSHETATQTDSYSLGLDAQWEADLFNQQSNATNSA